MDDLVKRLREQGVVIARMLNKGMLSHNPIKVEDTDEWKAAAEIDRLQSALDEVVQQHVNLLCRIHRDGGHYIEAHGIEKAYEDADLIVATLNCDSDEHAEAVQRAREGAIEECAKYHDERADKFAKRLARQAGRRDIPAFEGSLGSVGFGFSGTEVERHREALQDEVSSHQLSAKAIRALHLPAPQPATFNPDADLDHPQAGGPTEGDRQRFAPKQPATGEGEGE